MRFPLCCLLLLALAGCGSEPLALPDLSSAIVPAPGPKKVAAQDSILSEYHPQAPPAPHPPPYSILRFNEDYRYLSDPKRHDDFFDPAKYIPLNPHDPYSYLSIGGEVRERFEGYGEPGFGVGKIHHDAYDLQRLALSVDLHVDRHWRFFVQTLSGLQFGGTRPAGSANQDALDLQQAFVDYRCGDRAQTTVRVGRFEMTYGAGRLVATRAAPNIQFKYDGLQIIESVGGGKIYAFVTKPARERISQFDDEFPGQLFWGIYATTPPLGDHLRADLYYLGFHNPEASYARGSGVEERHTLGTRLYGKVGGFDYDVEPVVQFGQWNHESILAYTVASSFGYTFSEEGWKPRLGTQLDYASGDSGRGTLGTFNPLYFKAGYFNDASLIRPSNIVDVHPNLQVQPRPNVTLSVGSDLLWRADLRDGVYGPGGGLEVPAGGTGRYVATTAEISAQWQINRHLALDATYVHFFSGSAVQAAGGHDVDFVGSWLSFTF